MKITWINHAGFLVESGDIRLVSDPWIEGTAFDDGWQLLSPTKFQYADFVNVTHIWFSHEHPDHFSPANVKKIDASIRSKITVLYQTTKDKKVVKFCKNLGFKNVIELPPSKWLELSTNFKVMNQNDKDGDSWLAINAESVCILNLNDVVSYASQKELKHLKNFFGKVDVLLTQFSYANWAGNPGDILYQKNCAKEKIAAMLLQIKVLQPNFVIPFASFIWFCHSENYYLNECANKIEEVNAILSDQITVKPVILYPGDEWIVGNIMNSKAAIEKYNKDYFKIDNNPDKLTSTPVSMEDLTDIGEKYVTQILKTNTNFLSKLKLSRPVKIYLTDLNKAIVLTLKGIDKNVSIEKDKCDIAVSSSALAYCFKFDWGGGTLNINARFEKPPFGMFKNMENYFYISTLNNMGMKYTVWRALGNTFRKTIAGIAKYL